VYELAGEKLRAVSLKCLDDLIAVGKAAA
jgi:hypothetical protein